jgi:hypothetical protein
MISAPEVVADGPLEKLGITIVVPPGWAVSRDAYESLVVMKS